MDFSNPIASIISWTYQWAVTFVHRAMDTGLHRKAASLERQRKMLASSLLRTVELIDRLGDDGWGGLSEKERRDAERDLEQIQHVAKGHNPNKRPDCILIP
jgi:hypothetical protein